MTLSQVPPFQPLATAAPRLNYRVVYTGQSQYPAGPHSDPDAIDSFAAVTVYLRSRLLDTFSAAAASMAMRPSLQEVYTNLLNLLSSTAETPGANHSFLLLGARGTGKSLVWRHCSLPAQYCSICTSVIQASPSPYLHLAIPCKCA